MTNLVEKYREMKKRGEKVTALTAYDYPTARLLDESGIDVILVGDSLGMVVLGYEDTTQVTLPEMVHHTRAVARGVKRALLVRKVVKYRPERPLFVLGVISDMPWWKWTTRAFEKELVARVGRECNSPGDILIVSLRLNTTFRRPLRRVRGGEIDRVDRGDAAEALG